MFVTPQDSPNVMYFAHYVENLRKPLETSCFAVVTGETACQMLARSTDPRRIKFTSADHS